MTSAEEDAHRLLHKLWTRAVGKPGYVKKDWLALEKALFGLTDASTKRAEHLRYKLGRARGMLYSARGVIDGTLPEGDCTAGDLTLIIVETADAGGEWPSG